MGEAVIFMGLNEIFKSPKPVPHEINMQLKYSDFVCKGCSDIGVPHSKIEVKTEQSYTGNFFFETMSNVETERLGWVETTPADELFYLFWDEGKGYRIPDFQKLKFLFDYDKKNFREVSQRKHTQANHTKGRLVPISWVKSTLIGMTEFDFSRLKTEVEKEKPQQLD
jgi:hypothetical protein